MGIDWEGILGDGVDLQDRYERFIPDNNRYEDDIPPKKQEEITYSPEYYEFLKILQGTDGVPEYVYYPFEVELFNPQAIMLDRFVKYLQNTDYLPRQYCLKALCFFLSDGRAFIQRTDDAKKQLGKDCVLDWKTFENKYGYELRDIEKTLRNEQFRERSKSTTTRGSKSLSDSVFHEINMAINHCEYTSPLQFYQSFINTYRMITQSPSFAVFCSDMEPKYIDWDYLSDLVSKSRIWQRI